MCSESALKIPMLELLQEQELCLALGGYLALNQN
jgi:hypothetical protein